MDEFCKLLVVSLEENIGSCELEVKLKPFILTLSSEEILHIGSTFLNLFVQLNWCGPAEFVVHLIINKYQTILNTWSIDKGSSDEECWYELVNSPYLLYLAKMLLINFNSRNHVDDLMWYIRCVFMEQRVLSFKSNRLWSLIEPAIDSLLSKLESDELNIYVVSAIHLEISHYFLFYYKFDKAKTHLLLAQESCGIKVDLGGVLGQRTKFQNHDIAQLIVRVERVKLSINEDQASSTCATELCSLPKDISLNDDTLLDQVKYFDAKPQTVLKPLEQAIVLGLCDYQRLSTPVHKLCDEEIEAHLNFVLSQSQSWCIQMYSLYCRSIIQKKNYRTIERSMAQLEELLHAVRRPSPEVLSC
jgi:hypothetical protein